jgi:hypothetical protein
VADDDSPRAQTVERGGLKALAGQRSAEVHSRLGEALGRDTFSTKRANPLSRAAKSSKGHRRVRSELWPVPDTGGGAAHLECHRPVLRTEPRPVAKTRAFDLRSGTRAGGLLPPKSVARGSGRLTNPRKPEREEGFRTRDVHLGKVGLVRACSLSGRRSGRNAARGFGFDGRASGSWRARTTQCARGESSGRIEFE